MRKEYDLKKMKIKHRGPIVDAKSTKVLKTIRLDLDIVGWLVQESEKKRLPYQSLINSILKEAMDRSKVDQNEEIRKMIQEEIKKTG